MDLSIILRSLLPYPISILIIEYDINECNDCKKNIRIGFMCKTCSTLRCKYCHYVNATNNCCKLCKPIIKQMNMYNNIMCIKHPTHIAIYGYNNIICYCGLCIHDKKVKHYTICNICMYPAIYFNSMEGEYYCEHHVTPGSQPNYIDLRTNIQKHELKYVCYACNKLCTIIYKCSCGIAFCIHCYKLNTWYGQNYLIKCNICRSYTNFYTSACNGYIRILFPCVICSQNALYVDPYNFKYYCSKHIPKINKHNIASKHVISMPKIYKIDFTEPCQVCYAPTLENIKLCITHFNKLKSLTRIN